MISRTEVSAKRIGREVKENGQTIPSTISFYYKPADIDVYQGYLLVTRQTAMRKELSVTSPAVMALPVDTVLWTAGQYQSGSITWNSSQTVTGQQLNGWVNDVMRVEPLADKWRSFGFHVIEIDGNNIKELCEAIDFAYENETDNTSILKTDVRALNDIGYTETTEIQSKAIPEIQKEILT